MKNFPIIDKETGREYWISRSVAVLGIVIIKDKKTNTINILAEQRGEGTPDPEYVGCWCLPCGYLDFDESGKEAIAREVYEETGLNFEANSFNIYYVNDDPKSDKRQNVTLRYICNGSIDDISELKLSTKNSEKDEVMDVAWIPINNINRYKWAFNHDKILQELISDYNLIEKTK